jgi:tetratricopeptide (TPR) repeat protein
MLKQIFPGVFLFIIAFTFTANPQENNLTDITNINELIIPGESIEGIETQIINDSTDIQSFKKLASLYNSLNRYEKAIEILQRASLINPEDKEILWMTANGYLLSCQLIDAKKAYEEYTVVFNENIEALLKFGRVHLLLKDWKNGKAVFEKLISMNNSTSNYYEQLAKCNEALKEYDDAIVNLQIANRLNPRNIQTILRLGNLFFISERPISALRVFDAALQIYPQLPDLWRGKGDAHFRLKEYEKSSQCYQQTLTLRDTTAILLRNLGISYYYLNNIDSSISALNETLILDQSDAVAAFYLGVSFRENNNFDDAIKYLIRSKELFNNEYLSEIYVQLGTAYQSKKDYEKSVYYYNKALEENPMKKTAKLNLAVAYDEYYADKSIALKHYNEFVKDSASVDRVMLEFAKNRIEQIKEELHFSK